MTQQTWQERFDEKYPNKHTDYDMWQSVNQSRNEMKDFISNIIQTEQTRIAEEVEKTSIEWEDSKDELYTYFGKCSCGETSVIVGSKYCYGCGKLIKNPLRSSESLSIIKQGK